MASIAPGLYAQTFKNQRYVVEVIQPIAGPLRLVMVEPKEVTGKEYSSITKLDHDLFVNARGWKPWKPIEGVEERPVSIQTAPTEVTKAPRAAARITRTKDKNLPDTSPVAETKAAPVRKARAPKRIKVVKRMGNQHGVAEGYLKLWCSACMKSFLHKGEGVPSKCPEGHLAEVEDDLAPVGVPVAAGADA